MALPFAFWPHAEDEIAELARQYINGTHKIPDEYVELLEAPPETELFVLERAVEQVVESRGETLESAAPEVVYRVAIGPRFDADGRYLSARYGVLTLVYSIEGEFLEDYFDA
ncbi:MAG TPA: hypothetical protein VIC56_05415 [Gemmatimonadota bacterium]